MCPPRKVTSDIIIQMRGVRALHLLCESVILSNCKLHTTLKGMTGVLTPYPQCCHISHLLFWLSELQKDTTWQFPSQNG